MRRLRLTRVARADIAAILRHSRTEFGDAAQHRYRALIEVALDDLLADPDRPGVAAAPKDLRLYHLRHSRRRGAGSVGRPRHLVVFRCDLEHLTVLRLLHDSMDVSRRLS